MLLSEILEVAKKNGWNENESGLVEWLDNGLQQTGLLGTTLIRLVQALGKGKVAAIGGGGNGMATVTIPAQSHIPAEAKVSYEIYKLFDGAGDLVVTTKVILPPEENERNDYAPKIVDILPRRGS